MSKQFRYDDVPPVNTDAGKLQGYYYDGLYIFKGVPYAEAERFHMPKRVKPWEGVKDACSYGLVCPLMQPDKPTGELMVPHRYWPTSEHCQNLNIWTKTLDANAKKPVLVWLHGGGYTMGSSIEQEAYDGANMSSYGDVVIVTVNHRLNIFGCLDLSSFGEEYKNSGALTLADLVISLEWVRDNILNFGGDPDNVTIFGQSGGGMKVTGLMQIPAADGLYHKAFVLSGVSDGKLLPPPKKGVTCEPLAKAMAKELAGKSMFSLGKSDITLLEKASVADLTHAYNKAFMPIAVMGGNVAMTPAPNDYYLGEPLMTDSFTEYAKNIPLLVGSVFGEFAFKPQLFDKSTLDEKQILDLVSKEYKKHANEAITLFKKAFPDKHPIDLLTLDRVFRIPSKALAKLHAKGNKDNTYLYEFTLNFDFQHGKTAWHCSDIPFFFRNTDKVPICNIDGVSDELEDKMFKALIQFARSGNPNCEGLPEWNPVTTEEEPTMIFDRTCHVENNFDDDLMQLMEKVLPPFNIMEMMKQDIQH